MNPNSNEAGLNLPPPVTEQAPPVESAPADAELQPQPATTEKAPAANQSAPATAVPLPPLPALPLPSAGQSGVTGTTTDTPPTLADDGDLIEKEWVEKAKQIVERNRDDPYRQTEELTLVKAEYMKKRYNKTVKVNE